MTILKSPDNPLVRIKVMGICRTCEHYHPIDLPPDLFGRAAFDWEFKHRQCEQEKPGSVEFLSPSRWIPRGFDDDVFEKEGKAPFWLALKPNADIKLAYAASAATTGLDLSALAASATWVAGRESDSISNASHLYLDYDIGGSFISGTSPTSGEARLYYVRSINDTPTWPDVFDGTGSAETVTNTSILDKLPLGWSGGNSTSSNITYPIVSALTIAQAFGFVPEHFVLFFTHSQVAALKTDANNTNPVFYRGVYATSI